MRLFSKKSKGHMKLKPSEILPPPPRLVFRQVRDILNQAIDFDNRGDKETRDCLLMVIQDKLSRFLKDIDTRNNISPEMAERFKREIKEFHKKQGL